MFRTLLLAFVCLPSLALAQSPSQLPPPSASVAGSLISDDLTNAQGFGTAALSNGHLNIQKIAGMVFGAGQTAAVQSANGTLLQKAFNYCDSAGVECDEPDVLTVEYNIAGGLSVPFSGNGWRGRFNKRFNMRQAAINAPVLVLADATGANYKGDVDWDGGSLNYINDQTGQTNSITFLEGALAYSSISNLTISSETLANGQAVHPGYDLWDRGTRTSSGFSFTNRYTKITGTGAQASLFRQNLSGAGTGNWMEDIYLHNGGNIAGAGVLSDTGIAWFGGGRSDDICVRCNFEHFISPDPIHFRTTRNTTFIGMHVEDVGTQYSLISDEGSQVRMIGSEVLNFRGTANGTATANNVSILKANYGGSITLDTFTLTWDNTAPFASTGSQFFLGQPGTEGSDADVNVVVNDLQVLDAQANLANAAFMTFEPQMPVPLSVMQRTGRYVFNSLFSTTTGAEFTVAGGPFTLYGQHQMARIMESAGLSSASTVTLANTWKASGLGSTRTPQIGTAAVYHRNGGTLSGQSTVVNGAGTTLLTDAAASGGTASFATNVMTATAPTTGAFAVGEVVTAAGVAAGTTITSFGSGTGAAGTYSLSSTPGTVASETVSAASPLGVDAPFVTNGNNFAVAQ